VPRPNLKNLLATLRQAGVRVYTVGTAGDVHIELGPAAPEAAPARNGRRARGKAPPPVDMLELALSPPDFDPDVHDPDEEALS